MEVIEAKYFRPRRTAVLKDTGLNSAIGYLGSISFYGLLVAIFVFAIPYGTVETWHKSLLVMTIAILAVFRVLDGIQGGQFRMSRSTLLFPMFGVLLLAVVQIVPLPGTTSVVSVDPYETKGFILVFGGLLVAGEILFFYTDSISRLKCLVGLVIAVGVGSAVFGILRELFLDSNLELSGYLRPDEGFAQFINRNHFAMLAEMSLGLVLGILIKGDLSERFKFVGWVLSGTLIYSIIASNSRGGLISLAALSVFAIFVHIATVNDRQGKSKRGHRTITHMGMPALRKVVVAVGLSGLILGLIVFTVAFVGGDAVASRVEKLSGEVETVENSGVNRKLIWSSTVDLIKDKPLLGSGFGAYAQAIPRFDGSAGRLSLWQAHNDYLEILANGGILGFVLFACFGVLLAVRISRNLASDDAFRRSCCFGASIGMFGVLIHSFVDFGLHILINALIFTVLVVIAGVNIGKAKAGDQAIHSY